MSMENDAIIGVGAGVLLFFLFWKYGPHGTGGSGSGNAPGTSAGNTGGTGTGAGDNPNSAMTINCDDPNADPIFCAMLRNAQQNLSPGA